MPDMVTVKLLRPLNGEPIGSEREYEKPDAERLASSGAVTIIGAKADAPVANKMESPLANKAAPKPKKKGS